MATTIWIKKPVYVNNELIVPLSKTGKTGIRKEDDNTVKIIVMHGENSVSKTLPENLAENVYEQALNQ